MDTLITSILTIVLSIAISVVPVLLTARKLKIAKSGFLACFIAVIFAVIIKTTTANIIPIQILSIVAAIAILGFVYSSILETDIKKGSIIAAVAVLLQTLVSVAMVSLISL